MEQNRLKSPVVWGAVLAQVLIILQFVLTPEQISTVQIIAVAVLEILTIVGVLNNPRNKTGF